MEKSLTQDNAASFAEVELYHGYTIVSVENPPVQTVRFGTPLEKILKNVPLPEAVEVYFGGDKYEVLPVIWSEGYYNSNVPGDYTFTGHIYKEGVANFKNVKALYTITVLPKDETRPPNVEGMKAAVAQAKELNQADYTAQSWGVLEGYLNEAANFGALTAATQHDADVLTEEILDAIEALIPVGDIPTGVDKTALTEALTAAKNVAADTAATQQQVIDAAAAKGVKLEIEIGGKEYLVSSYKIDASAVYYSGTELIAMADGEAKAPATGSQTSNPETGGEAAAVMPNAAAPAGAADSANETIGAQQAAEQGENYLFAWAVAMIALLAAGTGAHWLIRRRKQNENK